MENTKSINYQHLALIHEFLRSDFFKIITNDDPSFRRALEISESFINRENHIIQNIECYNVIKMIAENWLFLLENLN